MNRRGLTLIEVMITIAVLTVGILVIVSSFSMNLRQSSQTRGRLLADLVLENLVEEVLAHPYGDSAPSSWANGEKDFQFIVEGKPQQSKYTQTVETQTQVGNGSFFGKGAGNVDHLTLTVKWVEASGQGNSSQNETLSVNLTVRREL
jgi:prepilin-type N-terminal cleavage/methylation domain-containing protein